MSQDKDEILAMAREAGAVFDPQWGVASNIGTATFERFAALCRAPLVTRHIESAILSKLRGGVELPEPFGLFCGVRHDPPKTKEFWGMLNKDTPQETKCDLFTRDQLLQYGDARALAANERGTCTWTEQDDKDMPSTYESSCGEMWSFIDGGVKENRVTYCHHCGGKVVPASPLEQT